MTWDYAASKNTLSSLHCDSGLCFELTSGFTLFRVTRITRVTRHLDPQARHRPVCDRHKPGVVYLSVYALKALAFQLYPVVNDLRQQGFSRPFAAQRPAHSSTRQNGGKYEKLHRSAGALPVVTGDVPDFCCEKSRARTNFATWCWRSVTTFAKGHCAKSGA